MMRPLRELKGFQKIELDPGQSQELTFFVGYEQLAFYDGGGRYTVEPGKFEVWLGTDALTDNGTSFRVTQH